MDFRCFIKNISRGNKMHFLIGLILTFFLSPIIGYGIAFGLSIMIGGLKELYDYISKNGKACWSDFSFTAAGSFIGGGLATLFEFIIYSIF